MSFAGVLGFMIVFLELNSKVLYTFSLQEYVFLASIERAF